MNSYYWVLEDASGGELRWSERFDGQDEAESWMSREWARIREEGAAMVVLRRDEEVLYRMSLDEA